MKQFLLCLSLIISEGALCQSTWVQRLNYGGNYPYNYYDSLTKVIDISEGADGDLYVLAQVAQDWTQKLFKISPTGSPIKWWAWAGYHGPMNYSLSNHVRATSDSGCVTFINYNSTLGVFKKFSKNGIEEWTKTLKDPEIAIDIIENKAGNYYALSSDSLYELDHSGKSIQATDTLNNTGSELYEMPNGKLILTGRINPVSPTYYYAGANSSITKIKTDNDSVIWIKSYPFSPISSVETTSDGGFIAVCGYNSQGWPQIPGYMFRADSLGNLLWSRTFNFPHFGFSFVKETSSGNIITGGTFIFTSNMGFNPYNLYRDYSAFVASLDSSGNGPLQTTSLTWPGDANNNQYVNFSEDALYTMVALGAKGPKRDTLDITYHYCPYSCGYESDYAADWANSFCNGVNYKYADFNGDGIIDTNDVVLYKNFDGDPYSIPNWRLAPPDNPLSTPDFKLIPERDSINAGDSVRVFIVVGSTSPVDTIYGLAFSVSPYYGSDWSKVNNSILFKNSALGTIGTDLFQFICTDKWFQSFWDLKALICRTNHQDVYNLNDTLGYIILYTDSTRPGNDSIILQMNSFNAITSCGDQVSFNTYGGSIIVNRPLSVLELNKNPISLYPNPTSGLIYLSFDKSTKDCEVDIFNVMGEKVYAETLNGKQETVNCKLNSGVYFVKVSTEGRQYVQKIVVE